ncbi:hypothetical protein [Pseudomonas sp. NPDC096950]
MAVVDRSITAEHGHIVMRHLTGSRCVRALQTWAQDCCR